MDKSFSYGILGYSSINIGDEIQSVASSRFIPKIDEIIYRESINKYSSYKKTKLIMNAWWMWEPKHFLPSKCIEPLLISMHIRPEIRKKLLTRKVKKYLIKKGPVGCRDMGTYEWLKNESIPSYFSGCLTLTLEQNSNIPKSDYILCVDVAQNIIDIIKERTNRPVINLSKHILPSVNYTHRLEIAKMFLSVIQSAHCVISHNIHTILPAIALNTPALFLLDKNFHDSGRTNGLIELCNKLTENDFINNINIYDFENPPNNPQKYQSIKNKLIKKCYEYTEFNNINPLFGEEYTTHKDIQNALKTLSYLKCGYYTGIKNIIWFATVKDLFKVLIKKIFGCTRHNLKWYSNETLVAVEREKERASNKPNGL